MSETNNKTKKSVKFPEEESHLAVVVCEIPHREEFSPEDMASLFFTRENYQHTRSAARIISKEAERYGFSKCLEDTYCEKSSEAQTKLNEWVAYMTTGSNKNCSKEVQPIQASKRGLERWANSKHGEIRQQDQFSAIMAVLRAQDDMVARKNAIDMEKLRKVSYRATKKSRHFARMMGKADSFAMAQELQAERVKTAASSKAVEDDDDRTGLTEAMSHLSTDTDTMSVMTYETTATSSPSSVNKQPITLPKALLEELPIDVEPCVGGVDELRDSHHEKFRSLRRFGFGRNKSSSSKGSSSSAASSSKPKAEARISRVA